MSLGILRSRSTAIALLVLGVLALGTTSAAARSARKKKKARKPAAAPLVEAPPVAAPEPPRPVEGAVPIGAPAAGAGRLVVFHLAEGLTAQAVDVYSKSAAPGNGTEPSRLFDRIGERVPYGGAAAGDRPPGGVTALSLPAGDPVPSTPGMFSGPTVAAGGVVHIAVVGGPRSGGYLHGHLASVTGEFPEGAARIGWSEVRGREGRFEVCADSGAGPTKWFHYEVGASTWPISNGFTGKGWETFRNVPPGLVIVELRERVASECTGKILGRTSVALPGGAVKLIHYGAGVGHLLICPQGPPFDCVHRAFDREG